MNNKQAILVLSFLVAALGLSLLAHNIVTDYQIAKLQRDRREYIIRMQHNPHGQYFRDWYDTNGAELPRNQWPTNY